MKIESFFEVTTTASLGLCALYYGVKWLVNSLQILHAASEREKSKEYQDIQRNFKQIDPKDARQLEQGWKNVTAAKEEDAIFDAKTTGLLYATGSSLMLFAAGKTIKSLCTGESMGYVAGGASVAAAMSLANTLRK